MSQNNRVCFICRNDGNGWVRSRSHHQDALYSFLNTPYNLNDPSPIEVSVPHSDGGNFSACFTRVNQSFDETENTLCNYVDEYGQRVGIMMCKPSYAAYINRVVIYH
jgi:chloramphenicol O-acetyltransferase